MLLAHLNRAKRAIPLASLPLSGDGTHILHHDIREWHCLVEVSYNAGFGLPSGSCRGRNPLFAMEPILEPFWSSPFSLSSCSSHGSRDFDSLLDMIGGLNHQVRHRVPRSHDTEALELGAGINSDGKGLVVGLLFVTQLDEEQAQLISLWSSLACFQEKAGLAGMAEHQRHSSAFNDGYSHTILSSLPGSRF